MLKARTLDSMQSFAIVFIITLLAMGSSLWGKGGIFLLDFVLSDGGNFISGESLGNFIMKLFGWIFGYEIATKSIIFSIHVLSGYLGILLSKKIEKKFNLEKKYQKVGLSFFGALFFIMNPFAYERMLTQPMVYGGIIMIGYGIYSIFFREKFLFAGISFGFAFGIFPHASFMILLILLLTLIFYRKELHIGKFLSLTILPILLINSNWLTSVTFGNIKNTIDSFSSDNFMAFTTQALSPLNTIFTNLLLYGFWGEQYDNHFVKANEMSPYWYIAGAILFASVIFGTTRLWSHFSKNLTLALILLGLFSIVFSVGNGSLITDKISEFMRENIPFWQGYREPQKWTGVLMVVEGVGFISFIAFCLKKWGNDLSTYVSICVLYSLLLYLWTPGVLFGYRGQLSTSEIPDDYIRVRNILSHADNLDEILILPWYGYIGCDWISRPTISNPAKKIFEGFPILLASNVEVGEVLLENKNGEAGFSPKNTSFSLSGLTSNPEAPGYIITLNNCSGYEEIKNEIKKGEGKILMKIYDSQSINLYKYVK